MMAKARFDKLLYAFKLYHQSIYHKLPSGGDKEGESAPNLLYPIYSRVIHTLSRHTIVCRAAQEAGAPHREYIDRKKENVIFTLLYLGDGLSD